MPVSFLLPCHDLLPGASLPTAGRTLRSLALRWALLEALRHGPSTTCHFGRLIPLPRLGRTTCRPSGSDTEQGWVSKKIGVISNMKRFHTVWGAQLARTGMEPYQVSETSYSIRLHLSICPRHQDIRRAREALHLLHGGFELHHGGLQKQIQMRVHDPGLSALPRVLHTTQHIHIKRIYKGGEESRNTH